MASGRGSEAEFRPTARETARGFETLKDVPEVDVIEGPM